MKLTALVVLTSLASCDPITKQENLILKQNCGKTVLNIWRRFKSYGGRSVKPNEFPWLAKIFVQRAGMPSPSLCGGVQISSRHILTAAHCVFEEVSEQIMTRECEKQKEDRTHMYKTLPLESFTIYVGSKCTNIEKCMQPNKAAEVWGHYDYSECEHTHDIAVIELKSDLPIRESSPICMPEKKLKLAKVLQSAGSGIDPTIESNFKFSRGLQTIKAPLVSRNDILYTINAGEKKSAMCEGDSGSPLFQFNSRNQYTVMGILAGAGAYCSDPSFDGENVYTDVRNHLRWICIHSGVCWYDTSSQEVAFTEMDQTSVTHSGSQNPSPQENYAHRLGNNDKLQQNWEHIGPGIWPNNQHNHNANIYGTYNTVV